ncbi:serine hydrolase [Streptococcus oricebi]|uniref:Serine hydrolase n=1 Tax=Streptococcus oricebi TaxID=1547447 RepID=A0ABS5B5J9_9STRE|nr:serine hydrolase [Streptococcus oricebi]MBP2624100.1 serine hydrolase [Streptococcus oricebi]
MRKFLCLLLLPAFLSANPIISTEQDFKLTEEQKYQLTNTDYSNFYNALPTNPNAKEIVSVFATAKLDKVVGQIKPDTPIKIKELQINEDGIPVFKLNNNQFLVADKRWIYDDQVLTVENVEKIMWIKPDFSLYEQAYVNGVKKITSNLSPYTPVKISQISQTSSNKYAKVDGKGWISLDDLSESDNRIEKVQDLLKSRYQKANYSIYIKQINTGKTAEINADNQMYAASIAKLPILYYAQEQLNQGNYQLSSSLKYIPEVNDYAGAYDTEGSGSLAKESDNKSYGIQDLINRIAKESDNAATNILGYYVTNKSDKKYQETIEKIAGKKWDVEERNASARMAGNMMEAIYKQKGAVLEALSQTNFDNQRIPKDLTVKVAHKIGDAYDFKHDVALVYTDSPFIISIFTNHSDYETISQIANDVYGVLK